MPTIDEIRQKYPQYNDMSDANLADSMHKKFYADMPREQFDQKIGFDKSAVPVGGYVGQTLKNVPSSAMKAATDIVQPIMHPVETVENLGRLGMGLMQKMGVASGSEYEKYPEAVGKFLVQRYGSPEAASKTLREDPVGLAMDLSTVLTGGETLVARVPMLAGKTAEVAGTVGRAIDPLNVAAKGVSAVAQGTPYVIGGMTHTGETALKTAAEAGYEGGPKAQAFQESMRGQKPMGDVVEDARRAVGNMRKERGQTYRDEMAKVGADKTVLNFDKVDTALADISQVKTFKGQVISPSTQEIRKQISQSVQEWKMLPPDEFHTVEGLDALKQKIGDIRDGTERGTPDRRVADQAYHAIRQTIVDQAPEYARVMKGYEEASDLIKEMERTLSLNPDASVDTALRKLQSVLRNNVNTNYGERAKLAEYLTSQGAPHLMENLAGQALSSVVPRGLGKMVGTEIIAAGAGALGAGAVGGAVGGLGVLPLMSPRLMGEAAYYTGKAAGAVPGKPVTRGLYQAGSKLDSPLQSPLAPNAQ